MLEEPGVLLTLALEKAGRSQSELTDPKSEKEEATSDTQDGQGLEHRAPWP